MKKVAILLSGRGSNFVALADAIDQGGIPAKLALVVSNVAQAPGLQIARQRGYPVCCLPSRVLRRRQHERELARRLSAKNIDVICLAGYMRVLSPAFVRQFPNRILNIHPSLLPAFTGLHAQRQALNWGAKVSGCTVHLVDEQLDHGPIVLQQAVEIHESDNERSLATRILEKEHQLYPHALRLFCQDRLQVEGRRVRILPS